MGAQVGYGGPGQVIPRGKRIHTPGRAGVPAQAAEVETLEATCVRREATGEGEDWKSQGDTAWTLRIEAQSWLYLDLFWDPGRGVDPGRPNGNDTLLHGASAGTE